MGVEMGPERGRMSGWAPGVVAVAAAVLSGVLPGAASAQTMPARQMVQTMVQREVAAESHRQRYMYLSSERSERTGGHLWAERVVETSLGRVRLLLREDGQPLSEERSRAERSRLSEDAAQPEAFKARGRAEKDEEAHARQMLELLGKGFVLENVRAEGEDWRIDFRPDANYSPTGVEERVLHGMSGWMLIDGRSLRMHHIEGRLPEDVRIGYGLLATVRKGSHFSSTKAQVEGQWRTVRIVSDFEGKAAIFKTIAKNVDLTRSGFVPVDMNLTVAQAVQMVEAGGSSGALAAADPAPAGAGSR